MFRNYEFKAGTIVEFNRLIHNRNEKIITEDTSFAPFAIKGKNNLIRLENFKNTVSDFLTKQGINFEIEKVDVAIRASRYFTDSFLWTFKLQSIECFALIAVDRNSKIVGLSYGEPTNFTSLWRNRYTSTAEFRVRQEDRCEYSSYDQDNILSYNYSNTILLNDFYYFLKYFGEFKENYLDDKNKKKLKNEFSKKIFRVKIAKLAKEYFDTNIEFSSKGTLIEYRHKISARNDNDLVFHLTDNQEIIRLILQGKNNYHIVYQRFAIDDSLSLKDSYIKLDHLEELFKIIRTGNK